jgi:hypothetical protein
MSSPTSQLLRQITKVGGNKVVIALRPSIGGLIGPELPETGHEGVLMLTLDRMLLYIA